MKIDIKNSLVLIIVIGALVWSIWYAYNRFYIEKDYLILQSVSCDPETENCFVWECDPATEECSANEEENIDYYKYIEKPASQIAECENPDECEEISCEPSEEDCVITTCMPEAALEEGVQCSNDIEPSEEPEEGEEDILEESDEALSES